MKKNFKAQNLLLFDGVCLLCNKAVQFLISKDSKGIFYFAPLQGETVKKIRARHPYLLSEGESIILVKGYNTPQEKIYKKSEAIIKSLAGLGGFWKVAKLLYFIPKRLRDWFYDYIAKNRYHWFAPSSSHCLRPTEPFRERFLD